MLKNLRCTVSIYYLSIIYSFIILLTVACISRSPLRCWKCQRKYSLSLRLVWNRFAGTFHHRFLHRKLKTKDQLKNKSWFVFDSLTFTRKILVPSLFEYWQVEPKYIEGHKHVLVRLSLGVPPLLHAMLVVVVARVVRVAPVASVAFIVSTVTISVLPVCAATKIIQGESMAFFTVENSIYALITYSATSDMFKIVDMIVHKTLIVKLWKNFFIFRSVWWFISKNFY